MSLTTALSLCHSGIQQDQLEKGPRVWSPRRRFYARPMPQAARAIVGRCVPLRPAGLPLLPGLQRAFSLYFRCIISGGVPPPGDPTGEEQTELKAAIRPGPLGIRGRYGSHRLEVGIAPLVEVLVRIAHGFGLGAAQHHLEIDRRETVVLVAVDHAGRA
jgi:hypothetical protein